MTISQQQKVVRRSIKDLDISVFVRRQLDHKRVEELSELLQNGVKLNAIEITEGDQVVDGRHRIESHLLAGLEEIDCIVISEALSPVELIAAAYKANTGGALPPQQQDKEHTIALLLEQRVSYRNIADIIGIPLALARKFIDNVKGRIKRQNMQKAALAVSDGSTIAKAADDYGVDIAELKSFVSGSKRKSGSGSIAEIKQQIAINHKSFASKNARLLDRMRDMFSDGDVNALEVREVFSFVDEHLARYAGTVGNRRRRFEADSGEVISGTVSVVPKKKRRAKRAVA